MKDIKGWVLERDFLFLLGKLNSTYLEHLWLQRSCYQKNILFSSSVKSFWTFLKNGKYYVNVFVECRVANHELVQTVVIPAPWFTKELCERCLLHVWKGKQNNKNKKFGSFNTKNSFD
jgi:hypothetical protein